ncbi:MAG: four helix bundle protein [Patescibacteria group bacterium]
MLVFYTEWHAILTRHIPKILRYSLGMRIDNIFAGILEDIALAQFSLPEHKTAYLRRAIGKNDTLKFMLYALFEMKGIDEKKFISLSQKAEEVGRMLYGWKCKMEQKPSGTKSPDGKNP